MARENALMLAVGQGTMLILGGRNTKLRQTYGDGLLFDTYRMQTIRTVGGLLKFHSSRNMHLIERKKVIIFARVVNDPSKDHVIIKIDCERGSAEVVENYGR